MCCSYNLYGLSVFFPQKLGIPGGLRRICPQCCRSCARRPEHGFGGCSVKGGVFASKSVENMSSFKIKAGFAEFWWQTSDVFDALVAQGGRPFASLFTGRPF